MNYYRLLAGVVLVMGTMNGFAAGEDSSAGTTRAVKKNGGVVIEYNEQQDQDQATNRSPVEKNTATSTTSAPGDTSVELIVGGSGEDGVAKRKEMPVGK